jgi:diguanylate cyclase (GGDEF)-like protein
MSSTPALLLLSPGHRDALGAAVLATGRQVEAARRPAGFVERYLRGGAAIVIVDCRGAAEPALRALSDLSGLAERRGSALVAIVGKAGRDAAIKVGATHVLDAPFADADLAAVLALAERFVARMAGGGEVAVAGTGAPRDALTGLGDARALRDWMAARVDRRLSLILVSVSRFDMINAAFGAESGDATLRSLAHRIEALVAETGGVEACIARMAGVEFGIALAGTVAPERLIILAQAIDDAVERPFSAGGSLVRLGSRIGVAQAGPRDRSVQALLRRASAALAEAKNGEAGHIRVATAESTAFADLTASLHADLRTALIRDEIDILFQPQVAMADGRVEGVEALARWRHPRHGELGAATLFATAEQSDYLPQLSAHVQRRALEIAAGWPKALGRLRLSVNVTAGDVARRGFASRFLAMVDASGFARDRLTVEITETGIMADLKAAARVIGALRDGGCRIAIDDFGTGHSSLAYLTTLPVDYLKIDSGLSADIAGSPRERIVVRGIMQMGRALGLSIVAEGVETEAQRALLAAEGCALYQGFLSAPPLAGSELAKAVR